MTRATLVVALAAIATASTVQAAPAPVVVSRIDQPRLGVLNVIGERARPLVAEDLKTFAPLFGKAVEARKGVPPKCDVLLIYARISDAGKVEHSDLGIREIVRDAGAMVAIVASPNTADAYIAGTPRTAYGRANLVMTLDRKGKSFPTFFASLFKMMFAGTTMPVAWVQLAPQGPGQDHADAPETIFAAEAGQVAFSDAAPAPAPAPHGSTERLRLKSVARTPQLEGPDELERAPIVTLTPELVDLDGRAMQPGQLERELANLKKTYGVLHPKDVFNGSFVLACAPETPAARLREQLGGALAAGFPTVLFAFLREIPGTGWSTGSAVRALVAPPGKKARTAAAGTVALAAHETCLELGRALVAARASQDVVRVELGEKGPAPAH